MRQASWISGLVMVWLLVACGGSAPEIKPGAMPEGGTFTGVWFSPQYGEMHMVQTGATVVGRYEKGERTGRIQGHVSGDLLRFNWTEKKELVVGHAKETTGKGYFRIVKDPVEDNYKLLGEWGHDEAQTGGGPWNAVKSEKMEPKLETGEATTVTDDSFDESSGSDWDEEEASDDSSVVDHALDGL